MLVDMLQSDYGNGEVNNMSVFSKLKGAVNKMFKPRTIENVLRVKPNLSDEMFNAILEWSRMYENRAPWLKEPTRSDPVRVVSLGLPALIASEKARMATIEMEAEINAPMKEVEEANPDYVPPGVDENGMPTMGQGSMTITKTVPKGDTERADYLAEQFEKVKKQIRRQLEYGIAKGGFVIKPYPVFDDQFKEYNAEAEKVKAKTYSTNASEDKEKKDYHAQLEFEYIQADGFYPLAFNASGKIIEAAFVQKKVDKQITYSRIEHHKLTGKVCTITNLAFKKDNDLRGLKPDVREEDLGTEIALTEVPDWAGLEPITVIEDVDRLLFAYFKMPEANTIDTYSPLGVSGYSRVKSLIKDADMQYSRMLWEFEGGEMAMKMVSL